MIPSSMPLKQLRDQLTESTIVSSLNRMSRSPSALADPSLYPYVRPITPPSDIATRTTSSDTGTSTSIRTNYSSTDSLSFLLRRRYLSLSNTPPEADYQCFPPDYAHSLVRSSYAIAQTDAASSFGHPIMNSAIIPDCRRLACP